jgi:hypothetical protein
MRMLFVRVTDPYEASSELCTEYLETNEMNGPRVDLQLGAAPRIRKIASVGPLSDVEQRDFVG